MRCNERNAMRWNNTSSSSTSSTAAAAHVLISLWLCHCVCACVCAQCATHEEILVWLLIDELGSVALVVTLPVATSLPPCSLPLLPLSCLDPLFTQTHQRQRRIQIVLMDCLTLPKHCLFRFPYPAAFPLPLPFLPPPGIPSQAQKTFAQYLYFTQFLLVASWQLPVAACLLVELICKPICYIVHVSQRIVYYQPTQKAGGRGRGD